MKTTASYPRLLIFRHTMALQERLPPHVSQSLSPSWTTRLPSRSPVLLGRTATVHSWMRRDSRSTEDADAVAVASEASAVNVVVSGAGSEASVVSGASAVATVVSMASVVASEVSMASVVASEVNMASAAASEVNMASAAASVESVANAVSVVENVADAAASVVVTVVVSPLLILAHVDPC